MPDDCHRFGWCGVDLFFVLSGFLIGGQLFAPLARGNSIRLGRFFARRALRILPAYFAVLSIYFLLPSWREYPAISPLWKFLISVQNIDLHVGLAFSHAWSLAVEDQFYLTLPFILILVRRQRTAVLILPTMILLGGMALRAFLAAQNPGDTGVSFLAFQKLIYYPTWTRLDPLMLGVVLATIEKFRPAWWERLTSSAIWLWLPALALVGFGLYLGGDLTVATCVFQFPLIALGMAGLLICAVSPRLPFSRLRIPGVAFVASISYSVYLSHKLVAHFVLQVCAQRQISVTSFAAIALVEVSIYLVGTILFLGIERPFLQLRRRIAS